MVDYSVHVWDIRRPYIPFASFNEHTNVTTGIAWQGSDSHCLLSISKDSTIYKHAFKDATRPALKANAQGASLGRFGDISFANKIKEYEPKTSGASNTKSSSFMYVAFVVSTCMFICMCILEVAVRRMWLAAFSSIWTIPKCTNSW